MVIKDQAVCVRVIDYSETSQIVTLWTRDHGKLSAIAKGAKRSTSAFDGPIELFSYGGAVYHESTRDGLSTLVEFQQTSDLVMQIPKDLFSYHGALLATELLVRLTQEQDAHPNLYGIYLQFLRDICDVSTSPADAPRLSLLILFELNLLKEIGLSLVLSRCVNCEQDRPLHWADIFLSHAAHGFVCRDCEMNFPERVYLSKEVGRCLAHLPSLITAGLDTLRLVEKHLIDHFTYLLHREPRTAKFVLQDKRHPLGTPYNNL